MVHHTWWGLYMVVVHHTWMGGGVQGGGARMVARMDGSIARMDGSMERKEECTWQHLAHSESSAMDAVRGSQACLVTASKCWPSTNARNLGHRARIVCMPLSNVESS